MKKRFVIFILFMLVMNACYSQEVDEVYEENEKTSTADQNKFPIQKSEEEWHKQLSAKAFHVLREKGTERAFTGAYHNHKETGTYICAACQTPLFSSKTKFDSGTGWPSFFDAVTKKNVGFSRDFSFGVVRTEVHCAKCGGHLGHVFKDGPEPTGLRYCINSAALDFKK